MSDSDCQQLLGSVRLAPPTPSAPSRPGHAGRSTPGLGVDANACVEEKLPNAPTHLRLAAVDDRPVGSHQKCCVDAETGQRPIQFDSDIATADDPHEVGKFRRYVDLSDW